MDRLTALVRIFAAIIHRLLVVIVTINCFPFAAELWVFAGALNEGPRTFRNYGEGPYYGLLLVESVY